MISNIIFLIFGVFLLSKFFAYWFDIFNLYATANATKEEDIVSIINKTWYIWFTFWKISIIPILMILLGFYLRNIDL